MEDITITLTVDTDKILNFFNNDRIHYGSFKWPAKVNNFCEVNARGIMASGIYNVFVLEPEHKYKFKLVAKNKTLLGIEKVEFSIIQDPLPEGFNWGGIFEGYSSYEKEVMILDVGLSNPFSVKSVEPILYKSNIQYSISFHFDYYDEETMCTKTFYGIIDPFIANTSRKPT